MGYIAMLRGLQQRTYWEPFALAAACWAASSSCLSISVISHAEREVRRRAGSQGEETKEMRPSSFISVASS